MTYMKRATYDVIVVGGGAAGMLASAIAAERGLRTLVVERNDRCGKKLRITGKGVQRNERHLTGGCDRAYPHGWEIPLWSDVRLSARKGHG